MMPLSVKRKTTHAFEQIYIKIIMERSHKKQSNEEQTTESEKFFLA